MSPQLSAVYVRNQVLTQRREIRRARAVVEAKRVLLLVFWPQARERGSRSIVEPVAALKLAHRASHSHVLRVPVPPAAASKQ